MVMKEGKTGRNEDVGECERCHRPCPALHMVGIVAESRTSQEENRRKRRPECRLFLLRYLPAGSCLNNKPGKPTQVHCRHSLRVPHNTITPFNF